ncbi:MAG: fused MFS/spermidine synthase [Nitrospinae bacterium]|nr:fused MFS/spermidine synthase [Nitrospinota bacterium]
MRSLKIITGSVFILVLVLFSAQFVMRDIIGVSYGVSGKMRDSFWKNRESVELNSPKDKAPIQLPGPMDSWGDGVQSEIRIQPPFREDTTLVLHILDAHNDHPPKLEIYAGGELFTQVFIKKGSGKSSWNVSGLVYDEVVQIPARRLEDPSNPIVIKNAQGSWVALDGISLNATSPMWKRWLIFIGWPFALAAFFLMARRGFKAASDEAREKILTPALYAAFTLSGVSAIIYQVAWQRMLGLFSGSDSVSSAIIVGAFLLGLGIGALAGGRLADSLMNKTAFILFALCEVSIGVFSYFSKSFLYDFLFGQVVSEVDSYVLIFAMAFAGLLIPTFLMGMSLPLLSKAMVREIGKAPARIGWLYGVNTIGAGIGAMLAGWKLVGAYGYEGAIIVAVGLNFLVAAGAMALAAVGLVPERRSGLEASTSGMESGARDSTKVFRRWAFLFFVSGFIAISLELVWFRVIGALFHSSPYTFSLVLAFFLVADGLGIIASSYVAPRLKNPGAFFTVVIGLAAFYAVASLGALYYVYGIHQAQVWLSEHTFLKHGYENVWVMFGFTFALTALPGFLLGFSFPIVQKAVHDDLALIGRRVGALQWINILGNTAGSLVTGLLIFMVGGITLSLTVVCVLSVMLLAEGFFARAGQVEAKPMRWRWGLAAALAMGAIMFPSLESFWSVIHTGNKGKCLVNADHTGMTALCEDENAAPGVLVLSNGGKVQGYLPFSAFHVYNSIFGPMLHPAPKKILLIGVGSGGQAYTLGLHGATESIHAVEIVAPVYKTLKRHLNEAGDPLLAKLFGDSRYKFTVGDGRKALYTSHEKYDIIQTDAITPYEANSGLLYSLEYFQQTRRALAPGGFVIQWIPTERAAMTFLRAFPYVTRVGDIMIGAEQPVPVDKEAMAATLGAPETQAYFEGANLNLEGIKNLLLKSPVVYFTPEDRVESDDINRDLDPRDEYFLNRPSMNSMVLFTMASR